MNRSILELLGILFLIFVIMSEPPEKKFKTEAVAKAHQIIRNSVVVPVPSIVAIQTVLPVVQVIPVVSVPSVVTNVAGGEYQTGAGQLWYQTKSGVWKKAKAPAVISNSSAAGGPTPSILPPSIVPMNMGLDPAIPILAEGGYQTAAGQS